MELTSTGLVLIVLGGLLFAISRNWLYILTIFFVPFTATAVINFPSGFWLTPFQLFGCMWILSEVISSLLSGKVKFLPHQGLAIGLISVFAGVVCISTIMPLIINGSISIRSPSILEATSTPLYFTLTNITRALYVVFGVVIAIFVAIKNSHASEMAITLKIYVLSGLFVSLWGWMQFIFYAQNIPYPDYIFNNSLNPVAQGFKQTIYELQSLKATRISSVAVEPSVFAEYLFSVIPIVLYAVIMKQPIISRRSDMFILGVMGGILVLSTSSSAYVGILILGFELLGILLLLRILKWKHVLMFIAFFTVPLGLYLSVTFVQEYVNVFLLSKLEAGSGLERLLSIEHAWGYFQEYPLMGVGWGSVTSHDLIVNLLANSGLIGLLSFVGMIAYILGRLTDVALTRNVMSRKSFGDTKIRNWAIGILLSIFTLLLMQILTGFTYGFGHFWVILGLSMSIYSVHQNSAVSLIGKVQHI
jgi:hypothetical protein